MITKDNFFTSTKADFKEISEIPTNEPHYISIYKRKMRVYKYEIEDWERIDRDEDENVIGVGYVGYDHEFNETFEYFNVIDEYQNYYLVQAEQGKISSKYWYSENGVTRVSDHWGIVASCNWTINSENSENSERIGFCNWLDFNLL